MPVGIINAALAKLACDAADLASCLPQPAKATYRPRALTVVAVNDVGGRPILAVQVGDPRARKQPFVKGDDSRFPITNGDFGKLKLGTDFGKGKPASGGQRDRHRLSRCTFAYEIACTVSIAVGLNGAGAVAGFPALAQASLME